MLKLGRVTKFKMLFLVLVFVFNFDLFKFSAVILEKGLSQVFGIWICIALHCACAPPLFVARPRCHVKQHLAVLALKKAFHTELA